MAKNKLDLAISLHALEIPSLARKTLSRHVLQAALLWPRVAIARKAQEQPLEIKKGKVNAETLPWGRRMLFKEGVEGHFGISLAVTVSLTQTEWENCLKYLLGQSFKLAAGVVDDYEPGGDLAALPLKYGSKQLQESTAARLLVKGEWDCDLRGLGDGELPPIVRIPLLTASKRTITQGRAGRETVVTPADSPDGFAEIRLEPAC